jgi:Protein of unknown function (DUF3037)
MNAKFYHYSTLKYRPSLLLDEQVNIGLLFVFVEDKRIEFLFPSHLARLNALYPQTNLNLIRAHLKGFKQKAADISDKDIYNKDNLSSLIATDFLQPDSNSLFFTDFKIGTYQTADPILDYYYTQFFSIYQDNRQPKIIEKEIVLV